ncbi:MAG: molybdenum ABC transporter ATP-binding protein [Verrucomicrobia bacterium]|nr:molybdenum ABC transporter ATP-binding protein [Verrucomicrobiota bacterium]
MRLGLDAQYLRPEFELDIALQTSAGVTGIFGASGAGKSTLMNIIAGLIRPDHGRLDLDGQTLIDTARSICVPAHRRRIGIVFQDARLFPHLTVSRNLRYGAGRLHAVERERRFELVTEMLELKGLLARNPSDISGGESQRVALGRALMASPRLLLLDEPFSAVDMELRQRVFPFIRRIRSALDVPMLVVSHDLTDILQLTDELFVMDGGKTVGFGSYLDLIHESPALRRKLRGGLVNIFKVNVTDTSSADGITSLGAGDQTIRAPYAEEYRTGADLYVSVRAEDLVLASKRADDVSLQNQIEGRIERLTQAPDCTLCTVDAGVKLLAEVTHSAASHLGLREGGMVWCMFKTYAVKYLS